MSLFSGDNEIGNILQDAVKLKSAQMGQKRKTYETWPYFVQHTIFHNEKDNFKAWRLMPFDEKIKMSDSIKDEGNKLAREKKYSDAVDKYEEAPSLFYYCYSTDPGWRKNNRGIDDDVLILVDDQGNDDSEAAEIKRLRLQCCLNLAHCKIKLAKWDEAVVASTVALDLDPDNVKALYRRAESRIRPTASTAYDNDMAIKDLTQANKADPTEKNVASLLKMCRDERKKQLVKDKGTFDGMFDRGEIYDKESMEEAERQRANQKTNHRWEGLPNDNEMGDLRRRVDEVSDEDPLEKRIADAELLRDLYVRNQKTDDAEKLNEQIQAAKRALKEQQESRAQHDFSNPSPEMIADAAKHGLDLNDPLVQAELKRIENEGPDALEGEDDDGPPAAPAVEVPLPEAPEHVPIPWARYVILLAVMILFLRLGDVIKLCRTMPSWLMALWWRSRADEEGGVADSVFARTYKMLFASREEPEF